MAFAAVERLIAFRYLRARREEGFISVIAGVLLRGMTPDDFRARTPLAAAIDGPPALRDRYRGLCRGEDDRPIDWGTLKGFGDDFTVAIGRRFADLMGLKVGDRLQLVSPVSV